MSYRHQSTGSSESATCSKRSRAASRSTTLRGSATGVSCPLNEDEVRNYAKDLKPVLDENWAMVAERKDTGEVVGAALTLPDFNQVLAKLNGRLLHPFPMQDTCGPVPRWMSEMVSPASSDALRVRALHPRSRSR
jgi:hypothetical protein